MDDKRVLTCVYCGQEYPQGTSTWGNKILTDHIKKCPKHPLREAEAKIEKLRSALMVFVGATTMEELHQIKSAISILPMPEEDKRSSTTAINVLLETWTGPGEEA